MIVSALTLAAFVPAALALNLTPGADMAFCLGTGLRSGPRAGMAASAGVALGCMVHVAIAGAGLGAAVAAAPWLFEVIRWAGVGYLLWLALRVLQTAGEMPEADPGAVAGAVGAAFRRGFLVNLTNPKVILFVLAFLPQFVDPARPVLPQFLILGGVIATGGLIVNGLVGMGAGGIGRHLGRGRAKLWLDRVTAGIFAALALRLALAHR
jgi:threonine/homoserine/homoserine lactone efflux protein